VFRNENRALVERHRARIEHDAYGTADDAGAAAKALTFVVAVVGVVAASRSA
jgi:hypothetical protein